MEVQSSSGTPSNWLFRLFLHPAMVTICSIFTVIGLPLSIFFYRAAIQKPELAVYVSPVRAAVVNGSGLSKLKVFLGNREVPGDITAAQIAIWNQGSAGIRPGNVLKEVLLSTSTKSPILEASVRKTTRDVVGLSLDQAHLDEGKVGIHWDILEKNDGGIIQLVYSGGPETQILASGVIEGQPTIKQISYSGKIISPDDQLKGDRYLRWLFVGSIIFGILLNALYTLRIKNYLKISPSRRTILVYRTLILGFPTFLIVSSIVFFNI